jgi:hypothetical protein
MMAGQKGIIMDKNVIAAVRQLEKALDTAIEHCGSTAELNAYFIMEQKVWSACGTCAQDLFWANKSQQHTSAKTETAPEAEIQERPAEKNLEGTVPSEVLAAIMTEKQHLKQKCDAEISLLRDQLSSESVI